MSGLHIDIEIPERDVIATFDVVAGEVTAILGPNGAGKSTVLAAVAGLHHPHRGMIELNSRVLTDTAAGIALPPHKRGTALLAQDALLFPHLTVADNVAFAPRSAGRARRESAEIARRWLDAVDAGELAERKPSQLSGGQAQRVAVARALAAEPELLLLDEPMAALDVASAPALRSLLRRVLRTGERTAVLVTHDALDALALADTVVVLDGGRVVERGDVRTVLTRPRSAFAARIAGVNLRTGDMQGDGMIRTPSGIDIYGIAEIDEPRGSSAVAVFEPRAVSVYLEPPHGSPRNAFTVTVAEIENRGAIVRVRAEDEEGQPGLSADITATAAAELDLIPGSAATFVVKATETLIYAQGAGS
ncbi:ATP-binding cassette domain-containing protein [Rhodococcus sp. IEGM 1379]|uniref:sulfate/molybdate ABC transporter ATP-binding protein n=1 Tax=Rhodococcus sp. IEGM 1379 TaxID=3047086 RepID=UPI0024B843DF|nr:ATP-binding cassette domain-containing protein [Rhodococcus sp. IEGM 1379]MDI9914898.1 ATP-binding cassette domain-containing protein [Rhodococcus sp. IEGM 1379]